MRWTPGDRGNIEDLRGSSGIGMRRRALGIGGLLVLLLAQLGDRRRFPVARRRRRRRAPTDERRHVRAASRRRRKRRRLVDFRRRGHGRHAGHLAAAARRPRYQPTNAPAVPRRDPVGVRFCASAASGPFYCPGDHYVYLDLGFFDELRQRVRRVRRFRRGLRARARVGHHVQTLTRHRVEDAPAAGARPVAAKRLSVRLELQADCFAGVWAHATATSPAGRQRRVEMEPRRPRGGPERRGRHRRRPHPADVDRPRVPREVHPRHIRAARDLAPSRLRERRSEGLQHAPVEVNSQW